MGTLQGQPVCPTCLDRRPQPGSHFVLVCWRCEHDAEGCTKLFCEAIATQTAVSGDPYCPAHYTAEDRAREEAEAAEWAAESMAVAA
jgi:hypothetical protein